MKVKRRVEMKKMKELSMRQSNCKIYYFCYSNFRFLQNCYLYMLIINKVMAANTIRMLYCFMYKCVKAKQYVSLYNIIVKYVLVEFSCVTNDLCVIYSNKQICTHHSISPR